MTPRQRRIRILELEKKKLGLKRKRLELESAGDEVSGLESFARGTGQGLSLGFIEEGTALAESTFTDKTYEESLAESRAAYKQAKEQNPVAYNIGDYGSTVGLALATGGASALAAGGVVAARVAGKAGLREGLKRITAKEGAKGLGRISAESAARGAVEGVGRSEDKSIGDAAFGGTIGAVAPGVFWGAGQAIKGGARAVNWAVPRPGRPGPISGPMSKIVAEGARLSGMTSPTIKSYKKLMDDPERLKKALKTHMEGTDFSPLRKSAKEFSDKARKAASNKYENMSGKAYRELGDSKQLIAITERASTIIKELSDEVGAFPPSKAHLEGLPTDSAEYKILKDQFNEDSIVHQKTKNLFKQETRDRLVNAQTVIDGGEPAVIKLNKQFENAASEKEMIRIASEHSYEMGKSVARAKKDLDDGINYASREGWSRDEKILRSAIDQLREITHSPDNAGGKMMQQADEFWQDYVNRGRPFLENLKDEASPDGVDTSKLVAWAKGSGGDAQREERRILHESFKEYTEKNFPKDVKKYQDFDAQFTPSRDAQDITRLGSEGGGLTSKSNIAAGAIYAVGHAIGGYPLGTALVVLSAPMTKPANYLKAYATARKAFRGKSEGELRGLLGTSYDRVMKAMENAAAKEQRLEDPAGVQDLYQNFDFGEGSVVTPRAQ